jgi:hypothetical protein
MEQVVDTMLHELAHNVHGPHDEKFHALWDQLRTEYEALLSKGYTGEGFMSQGHRLGGRSVPRDEARRIARAAAERRQILSAGSGQKLGGRGIRVGDDVRRVIADAAERRIMIMKGCGSHNEKFSEREVIEIADEAEEEGFMTKAEEEEANDRAIAQALWDLVQDDEREKFGGDYVEPSARNPAGSQGVEIKKEGGQQRRPGQLMEQAAPPWKRAREEALTRPQSTQPKSASSSADRSKPTSSSTTKPPPRIRQSEYFIPVSPTKPRPSVPSTTTSTTPSQALPSGWTCDICTLHNPLNFLCCDACGTERPDSVSAKVVQAEKDRTRKDEEQRRERERRERDNAVSATMWRCPYCTMVMESQWWTCSSCGRMKASS